MNPRLFLGIGLVIIGFFWDSISMPNINKPIVPSTDYNKILDLKKPTDKLLQELKDVKSIVSGPDEVFDREIIAIFNNEMGKRLPSYENVNSISFENFYIDSAKLTFNNRLSNKYKSLGDKMHDIILSTLGENEAIITKEEQLALSEKMRAIAWILLN
jgi:type I restriction-modification system DNA methylase subunit